MTIGSRIKDLRKKHQLTQKQLGDLCGMADSAIRRYENGNGNPTKRTLARIANALNVSVAELLGDVSGDSILNPQLINELHSFKTAIVVVKDGNLEFLYGSDHQDHGTTDIAQLMIQHLYELNAKGQDIALEFVHNLTKEAKYMRKP